MIYLRMNNHDYPVISSYGQVQDHKWNLRESIELTLSMTYSAAIALFKDNMQWSLVDDGTVYDHSDYSIAGDIVDHRDGTISIKMGKPTDLELAYELLYGGK